MDDLFPSDGFDRLMADLEHRDAEGAHLSSHNLLVTLAAAAERELPFDTAWSMAINRIQPSQVDRVVDLTLAQQLREDRTILEETRPYYQAAYEHRPLTLRERAGSRAAAWRRVPELLGGSPARPAKKAAA